jgi:citrate synthase
VEALLREMPPLERCQALLPLLAHEDLAAYDFRPESMAFTNARILRRMALLATGQRHGLEGEGIAALVQRALIPHQPQALPLLTAALILCADHELNVSSFTARCVASAGASPYAVVCGALTALQGSKHGGSSARVEGDPRGKLLLELVHAACPNAHGVALADALLDAARSASLEPPNIDFALATLRAALELPSGSAILLFALGRTIGWLGHAMEEYQADQMIRPRAHYTGILPTTSSERREA